MSDSGCGSLPLDPPPAQRANQRHALLEVLVVEAERRALFFTSLLEPALILAKWHHGVAIVHQHLQAVAHGLPRQPWDLGRHFQPRDQVACTVQLLFLEFFCLAF